MDSLKNAVGMGGGENKPEGQATQGTEQGSSGGGLMDKFNSMAGGGVDMFQEKVMGQGPQDNESAIEQAKDEQMSDFIRGKYKSTVGSDFPVADKE
ncbi:MAG: hypothetical protein Q9220_001605 [cf. Caloplaca sp. 1 TL-2023]